MSSPESPSSSHPARAAGFALIGVALVALVIGVVTLFGGGGDETAAGPSDQPSTSGSSAPAESTSASVPAPASSAEPPVSSVPPVTTTSVAPPATTTQPPAGEATPPAGQEAVAKPPVRVYNNSTISGLAAKATEDVKRSGWDVAETGNYSQGQIPTTTVYYRPGTAEEESAKALANVMQARVEARFEGIQAAHDGIIVIVTNDYRGVQNIK